VTVPAGPLRAATARRPGQRERTAPAVVASDARQAAAGTVALAVLQVAGRALALAFVLVATRMVLPAEFGRYSIVAGLMAFAGFVADFGSSTVITRRVSQDPAQSDELLAQTLLASLAVGLLGYVAIVGFLAVAPYPASIVHLGLIGGLAVPADAALTSMLAAMDGHGLISRRAVVTFVRIAVIAGGGALAVLFSGSITPAVVMIALGPALGCVLAVWCTRRYRVWSLALHPHWRRSLWLFRTALPYALLGGIGAVVARFDLLVLSWFAPASDVAPYDLALRAVEASAALGMVVGGPSLYILSRRLGHGDLDGARRAYAHAVRVAYLIGVPLSAMLVGLHGPLTRLAFGPDYDDAAPLLAVLGVSVALSVLGWVQGSVVLAAGDAVRALRAFTVVLGAALVVDFALIPMLGAPGAAIATVCVAALVCGVFDRLNRNTLGTGTPPPHVALVVSCAAGTAVMLAGSVWASAVVQLVGLGLVPALLLATRAVTAADIARLGALLAKRSRA